MIGFLLATVAATFPITCARASEVPLGHPDWYPSPERPLGWRGDGTGAYPGAKPVGRWNAGTGENIVWRTPMPGPSYCVPLVVGEKVITMADPNLLVCCNVHTGEVLWQRAIDHTAVMPPEMRREARELIGAYEQEFAAYTQFRDRADPILKQALNAVEDNWDVLHQRKKRLMMERIEKSADLAKALEADRQFAADWDWLYEEVKVHGWNFVDGGNGDLVNRGSRHHSSVVVQSREGMRRNLADYSVHIWNNWYGFVNKTYAVPVTDGEFIYVQTSNHAVACVDLMGDVQWLLWDRPDPSLYEFSEGNKLHTRFVISPVLHAGHFVCRMDGLLRCYDVEAGRKLWEHPIGVEGEAAEKSPMRLRNRQVPEACHHTCGSIPIDGDDERRLDIVIDPLGTAYRLQDGKPVCKNLPRNIEIGIACMFDEYYYCTTNFKNSSHPGSSLWKLSAPDADRVVAELVWHNSDIDKGHVIRGRELYGRRGKDGYFAFDLETGATIRTINGGLKGKYAWASLGGSLLMKGQSAFGVIDVEGGRGWDVEQAIVDQRIEEDEDFRMKWSRRGTMGFKANHAASFQANRMFLRSQGYLWCIGDPNKRFVVGRGCPDHARVD